MLATQWLENARRVMADIERTQQEQIRLAAGIMADSIAAGMIGCVSEGDKIAAG